MDSLNTLNVPASEKDAFWSIDNPVFSSIRSTDRHPWSSPENSCCPPHVDCQTQAPVTNPDSLPPAKPPLKPWLSTTIAGKDGAILSEMEVLQGLADTLGADMEAACMRRESATSPAGTLSSIPLHQLPWVQTSNLWAMVVIVSAVVAVLWLPVALCCHIPIWGITVGLGFSLAVQACDILLKGRHSCPFANTSLRVIALLTTVAEVIVCFCGLFWGLPLVLHLVCASQCGAYVDRLYFFLRKWGQATGWGLCVKCKRLGFLGFDGFLLGAVICIGLTSAIQATSLAVEGDATAALAKEILRFAIESPIPNSSLIDVIAQQCSSLSSISVNDKLIWQRPSPSLLPLHCSTVGNSTFCWGITETSHLEWVVQGVYALAILFVIAVVYLTGYHLAACSLDDISQYPRNHTLLNEGDIPMPGWVNDWIRTLEPTVHRIQAQVHVVAQLLQSPQGAQQTNRRDGRIQTDFLMAMSHELRTPVAGVIGHAEVLQLSALNDSQRHSARIIQLCGEAMLQLVGHILHYCQLCDTAVHLELSAFSLRQLLEDVVAVAEKELVAKGLQVSIHMDSDLPIHVIGDLGKLRQTIINLINNSIRFTPANGEISLCASWAKPKVNRLVPQCPLPAPLNTCSADKVVPLHRSLSMRPLRTILNHAGCHILPSSLTIGPPHSREPSAAPLQQRTGSIGISPSRISDGTAVGDLAHIQFEVTDTGVGIPFEQQTTVFEPFRQVDQSATRKFEGCGLGLSICKSLVTAMNGSIGIQSPAPMPTMTWSDSGTKVWFTAQLHHVKGEETQTEQSSADILKFSDLLVLLVIQNNCLRLQLTNVLSTMYIRWETTHLEDLQARVHATQGWVAIIIEEDIPHRPQQAFLDALQAHSLVLILTTGHRVEPNTTAKPPPRIKLLEWLDQVMQQPRGIHLQWSDAVPTNVPCDIIRNRIASTPMLTSSSLIGASPSMKQTVMVAEDNTVIQQLMRIHIERLGYQVLLCGHGQEVLDCLQKKWYPLIFMDYHMPIMDGLACTRTIRRWEQEGIFHLRPPIYIVGTTADVLIGTQQACLDAGMNSYLSKPVHAQQLATALSCLSGPSSSPSPATSFLSSVAPSPLVLPCTRSHHLPPCGPVRGPCELLQPHSPLSLPNQSSDFDSVMTPEAGSAVHFGRNRPPEGPPVLEVLRHFAGRCRTNASMMNGGL